MCMYICMQKTNEYFSCYLESLFELLAFSFYFPRIPVTINNRVNIIHTFYLKLHQRQVPSLNFILTA